tara:strand:+ start:2414 stop:3007 length:594 start_codon:yes stop_codon:yes gene_type:complete
MNNKQLIKVIRTLVEVETAKQQERFLSKTFPKILAEEVRRRLAEEKGGAVSVPSTQVADEVVIDSFQKAELALQEQRQVPTKQLSKNPILNEVLNQTQPFSKAQRAGGGTPGGGASVLDSLPQQAPIQESMDKTLSFTSNGAAGGTEMMRTQMAQKMGYGDVSSRPSKTGLGVRTGLPGLDKILNRDNSELVKKFKR